MKGSLFTLLFLWMVSAFGQIKQTEQLNWLEGRWDRVDVQGDAQAFELWGMGSGKELKGIGVMLDNKDTVFVERLSITRTRGGLYYITEVAHNAKPTYFKITDIGKESFICENEGHDFPKKIAYSLENGRLTVIISGNSRSMSFIFKKED
ncbi:MAG: DUF6265 family protein [Bacteroidota bacterium]